MARSLFERYGVPLVSVSKFVPGLGLITPPLMGTTAVDVHIYVVWELASVVAWATFWLLGGAAVERELHMLQAFVKARGGTLADILLAAALIYLLYRLYQRYRRRPVFARAALALAGPNATRGWRQIAPSRVLDARPGAPMPELQCRIPSALGLDPHSPEQLDDALRTHDMVIYCICPDSATALEVSQYMRSNGYTRIRALRGGLDAWQRRGFPVGLLTSPNGAALDPRMPPLRGDAQGAITLRGFAPRSAQDSRQHA
jgi:rhodanese-related sulfurtransferase